MVSDLTLSPLVILPSLLTHIQVLTLVLLMSVPILNCFGAYILGLFYNVCDRITLTCLSNLMSQFVVFAIIQRVFMQKKIAN